MERVVNESTVVALEKMQEKMQRFLELVCLVFSLVGSFGIGHSKNASKIVQNVSKWPKKNASENVIKKVQRRTKKWLKKKGGSGQKWVLGIFPKN